MKSLVFFAIWLALIGAIYSRIAPFLDLNRIFFSANENGTVKQNNNQISRFDYNNQQNFRKMKGKKSLYGEFCNYYCQNFVVITSFSPKIVRFQNGSNIEAIELRGVQFWSEIILEISNRYALVRFWKSRLWFQT